MPVKYLIASRLAMRMAVVVGLTLLIFSAVVGAFTYRYTFQYQLEQVAELQSQLVRTVKVQAEIAAFTANAQIAREVLDGLVANPTVLASRLESVDGFRFESGVRGGVGLGAARLFQLMSPVDHVEVIGHLVLVQNDAEVSRLAAQAALFQTGLMLVQLLAATTILVFVVRRMVVGPIMRLATSMQAIVPGSESRLPIDDNHATDEIGILSHSANAILDAAQTAIQKVEQQRNALEELATHDPLTGLPSRRLADDRLEMACNNAKRTQTKVALLFIDLDGFKAINDQRGHDAGDRVLIEIATRLHRCVRADDTVARSGGDEFIVILGNLPDREAAAHVARNIIEAVAQPITDQAVMLQLGASVGIALYPDPVGNPGEMRRLADQAMYGVKRSGKGHFAFASLP